MQSTQRQSDECAPCAEATVQLWIRRHGEGGDKTDFMRTVLGACLQCPPTAVDWHRDSSGKPRLSVLDSGVEFNLSHTPGYDVLAVSTGGSVGVDIERVRVRRRLNALAARCLHPHDAQNLLSRPAADRATAFCALWVLKEACLKCRAEKLFTAAKHRLVPSSAAIYAQAHGWAHDLDAGLWRHLWRLPDNYLLAVCISTQAKPTAIIRSYPQGDTLKLADASALLG
ncbi:MAG: 4'-phosphopantetheinyl transferase superfamily protein [Proteobacteria bacterium]|nr:4'-phosphopantetheinyl transferase superfamily protein [Pseudomonadota bacterium]